MTASTTTRYEAQVDGEIARISFEIARIGSRIEAAKIAIKRHEDSDDTTRRCFPRVAEAAALAEAELPGLRAQLATVRAELRTEEAKYTGWTRYYLVNNSNGHLHPHTHCSSCYVTTEYKWITEVSGMDEAELVELAGERCCTVCFPSAPVDKKADRVFRSDDEIAAEQRAAERDAKRAEKLKKAICADGSELVILDASGRTDETLKTIIAAENYYANQLSWAAHVERDVNEGGRNDSLIADYRQQAEQALAGLAARFGTDVETQRERLAPKLARKFKSDGV